MQRSAKKFREPLHLRTEVLLQVLHAQRTLEDCQLRGVHATSFPRDELDNLGLASLQQKRVVTTYSAVAVVLSNS